MAIGRDFASLLGVSEDASEAEVDARREALSDFFGSAEVPAGLQEWARLQALKLAETQAMNFPIGSQDSSAIAEPVEVDAQEWICGVIRGDVSDSLHILRGAATQMGCLLTACRAYLARVARLSQTRSRS